MCYQGALGARLVTYRAHDEDRAIEQRDSNAIWVLEVPVTSPSGHHSAHPLLLRRFAEREQHVGAQLVHDGVRFGEAYDAMALRFYGHAHATFLRHFYESSSTLHFGLALVNRARLALVLVIRHARARARIGDNDCLQRFRQVLGCLVASEQLHVERVALVICEQVGVRCRIVWA